MCDGEKDQKYNANTFFLKANNPFQNSENKRIAFLILSRFSFLNPSGLAVQVVFNPEVVPLEEEHRNLMQAFSHVP